MSKLLECGICGKKFYKVHCSIYHLTFAGKVCNCCSYTCYTRAMETKEKNNSSEYYKYRRELIDEDNEKSADS